MNAHDGEAATTATNEPDIGALLRDVRRTIATAKICEFENQAYRLGDFVAVKLLTRAAAADVLSDAAVGNGLVREHGDDLIQEIIARGLMECEGS
jgi:hypothetical protein